MTEVLLGSKGELELPDSIRKRYHLDPKTPVRIIETSGGILVIPLSNGFQDSPLAKELAEWQGLGQESWSMVPHRGTPG